MKRKGVSLKLLRQVTTSCMINLMNQTPNFLNGWSILKILSISIIKKTLINSNKEPIHLLEALVKMITKESKMNEIDLNQMILWK